MPEEQSPNGPRSEPQVKVNDRRRFTPEGEPVPEQERALPEETAAESPVRDARDDTIAQQAARIDELMRAYASLLEDGKAARTRLEREKARVLEAERAKVAQALLEAVDELERALAAAGDSTGPLVEGVRLTLASLAKKVTELGAERLAVVGERYDPHLAEAVDMVPVGDRSQDEVVVQEVRAGYRIGDKILRPARVRVGRFAQA
jgi:molecular chaperone GrpE